MELTGIVLDHIFEILVVLITGYFTYLTKKGDARADEAKRVSYLSMKMMHANTDLTMCMARNILGGDNSICDVQRAMENAEAAQREYNDYLERMKVERLY